MVGVEKDPRHRYATYTRENIGHYTNIFEGGVESQITINNPTSGVGNMDKIAP